MSADVPDCRLTVPGKKHSENGDCNQDCTKCEYVMHIVLSDGPIGEGVAFRRMHPLQELWRLSDAQQGKLRRLDSFRAPHFAQQEVLQFSLDGFLVPLQTLCDYLDDIISDVSPSDEQGLYPDGEDSFRQQRILGFLERGFYVHSVGHQF